MKHSLAARLTAACLFFTPALFAAQAEAPRRFAAPDTASADTPGAASGIGQVMLALVLVLAAVFAVAWLIKRMRGFSPGGAAGIEVVAQAAVGPKERVVIVRVANSRLLLGVAAGQVSLLQTLPAEPEPALPPTSTNPSLPPRFTELLRRSLGK
ncbi:MAG TPA: flagellar biosynthetic protein FliO [Steroidobacteraceae bacterium]|nr:flagellar biosynthetic protein FliO [Steroidobacteraceae bacterium]